MCIFQGICPFHLIVKFVSIPFYIVFYYLFTVWGICSASLSFLILLVYLFPSILDLFSRKFLNFVDHFKESDFLFIDWLFFFCLTLSLLFHSSAYFVCSSDLGGRTVSGPKERYYFPPQELNLGSLNENHWPNH